MSSLNPLHSGAQLGSLESVKEYLNNNGAVDIDGRDRNGNTALMNACLFGHDHVATYLLDKGANIEAKRPFIHMNALLSACQSGHCSTAKLLLDRGANIAAIGTIVGTCILLKVAESGNDLLLKLLLERGADVDALRGIQGTPLHSACAFGRTKCVEVLLRHGADVGHRNKGKTPLEMAQEYGHNSIIDLLMKHKKDSRTSLKRDQMTENQNSNLANGKKLKYEVINDHDCNEPPLLEQKLTSKIQEMERKFEKKLAELREHYERKEKDMIKSLKRVKSGAELARSNKKMSNLETQFKEISSLRGKFTAESSMRSGGLENSGIELTLSNEIVPTHTPEKKSLDDILPEVIIID
jgi:hypothetical protein